jgi:hypothetical protein
MPASYTYATLTEAIQDWMEDDSTEFTNEIPGIIGLAESMLSRDMKLEFFDSTEDVTVVGGTMTAAKPSGVVAVLEVFSVISGSWTALSRRSNQYIRDYWPVPATTGTTLYFSEDSETNLIFAPTPAANGTWKARCIKRATGLNSVSPTTTWLSTNAGDALFYACLVQAELFLKSDLDGQDRNSKWYSLYEKALVGAMDEAKELIRRDFNSLSPVTGGNAQ